MVNNSPFYMPKQPEHNGGYPVTYCEPISPELTEAEKLRQMIEEKYQLQGAD